MDEFGEFKDKIRREYDSIHEIFCPYFHEPVRFLPDGLHHIFYKNPNEREGKRRDIGDQSMRLRLLKLAPKLLKITTTVQELHKQNQFIEVKNNKRKEKVLKEVKYWGFIAIIDDRKFKVIVKQIGAGTKRFWSIIPNWITRKSHEKHLRIYHSGDLEND